VEWAAAGTVPVLPLCKVNGEPISPPEILQSIMQIGVRDKK
jgi:hypothetical protein